MREFSTERLAARDWRADIADQSTRRAIESELANVLTPAVVKHLPDSMALSTSETASSDWISARAREADVFLVYEKNDNRLLGFLLLAAVNEQDRHLGYILDESAWGKGYATELIKGLIASLSNQSKGRLLAGVGPGNDASVRVLEKNGFTHSGELSSDDTAVFVLDYG